MKKSRVVLGVASGCGCLLIVVMAVAGYWFYRFIKPPSGVAIAVEAPLRARVGETFEILVTLTNESRSERTLVDVDVADSYLAGIAVEGTDPAYSDSEHIPFDNTVSYSFDRALEPGGTLSVRFVAVAVQEGDFAGDFDLCIDSMASCVSQAVRTVVSAP